MSAICRSALVPYSPQAMYALVADIERYPDFLPWCRSARIHERTPSEVVASLEVARRPIRKTFTTRNRMLEPGRIDIDLVSGPFRHLEGGWRFEPLGDAGSKVRFRLSFEFSSPLLRKALEPLFAEIAGTMVDAFCRRAEDVYGRE